MEKNNPPHKPTTQTPRTILASFGMHSRSSGIRHQASAKKSCQAITAYFLRSLVFKGQKIS